MGEDQPRQIASGLRKYYPQASQLEGRKVPHEKHCVCCHSARSDTAMVQVLVLANLKPKKLGGFPSNGMVMCASNSDKSETIFVEVGEFCPEGELTVGFTVDDAGAIKRSRW